MIVTISELQLVLNMTTPTIEEKAVLQAIHSESESKVKAFLGYDPVQQVHTEYFPRWPHAGGAGSPSYSWDVNSAHTKALLLRDGVGMESLQLTHIPLRSITEVKEDTSGRFGSADGAFPDSSIMTEGSDFWAEWDKDSYCKSGLLNSYRGWSSEAGTVKITYRAGFSNDELNGRAYADGVTAEGVITTKGVDAAGIKRAIVLTVIKAVHTWQAFRRASGGQFVPGGFQSEKLGDYSYTLPGVVAGQTAGMLVQMPAEALEACEEHRHWGIMRT